MATGRVNSRPGELVNQHGGDPDIRNRLRSQTSAQTTTNEAVTLEAIMMKLDHMEKNQESMKRTFESKIDRLRTDLMASIDQKIKAVKDELSMDMSRLRNDYDELKQTVETLRERNSVQNENPVDDIERTVVLMNLKEERDDALTLYDRITEMIETLGESVSDVTVSQVKRLQSRNNKPGLVKVALDSKDSKIRVLKAKAKLKNTEMYKKVWMRSSKSHTERLLELNFKQVLQLIPGGEDYRITGSGRLQSRQETRDDDDGDDNEHNRGPAYSRRGRGPVRGGRGHRGGH